MFILILFLAALCFGAAVYLHKNTHGFPSHRRRVTVWGLKLAGVALVIFWLYVFMSFIKM